MQPIIDCRDISFSYRSPEGALTPVFEHLNFSVQAGTFTALLGHNGSGKSTLAKHFNAVLLPQGGAVYALGMDTREEQHLLQIRSHIGMVFQNPDNQIVATVVEEDVAFALENLGVEPTEIRTRVDAAMHAVGMYEYRKSAPHQLSGGQKQRVALAGIIAMRPNCIVLDEPTAMLDPRGRKEVMDVLRDLNKYYDITVVLITHFMDEAAQSDRVVVMDNGKILMDAPPGEVFSQVELLHSVGLDVPQASELAQALRKAGVNLPDNIITEQQCVQALSALLEQAEAK